MNMKKIKINLILTAFFFGFLFTNSIAEASTRIYFSPAIQTTHYKGDSFVLDLKISSDKSINVIDGTLTYNKDVLKIKNVSIEGSLISLWQTSPVFDNDKGTLTFVGGSPGGFKGEDGEVLRITFTARKEGITKVDFQDIFSVYLNDGKGTSISPWLEPLSITVIKKPIGLIFSDLMQEVQKPNIIAIILLLALSIASIIVIISFRLRKSK